MPADERQAVLRASKDASPSERRFDWDVREKSMEAANQADCLSRNLIIAPRGAEHSIIFSPHHSAIVAGRAHVNVKPIPDLLKVSLHAVHVRGHICL
jgi:hypothetical protein